MADRVLSEPGFDAPAVDTGRLAELHEAASAVRLAWDRLAVVREQERGAQREAGSDARQYIAALWQVQAAEEDYLRLREQLFGA